MNAVEIEEAVTELAEKPFDAAEFPHQFLTAFGNKATTIKRLRTGSTNASDLPGRVLQRSNIHIAVAAPGAVTQTLAALRASPVTAKAKAKFILATDGDTFEAEDVDGGETVACAYADFPNHFGFFLPLAGITTVKQIRESSFDIRATGRLNRLYVELLKDNPDWATADRRPDMNHFMAQLMFCFFAEDTVIFKGEGLFTATIAQMSERDSSNIHEVIGELFRAMNTPTVQRATAKLPRWADVFPYVNGGLFSGSPSVPRFSRIARSYLLHIASLDWTKSNPDIFGSMIQAVADDEERGALGMHYTGVPNILKVLNPLFLDDLRTRLDEAGDNSRMLLNLRRRMARIRIFGPACGSGNSLVIAYKEMRAIEALINARRGEADRASEIPLTNFRGIELRDFPADVARLALIIAEFQCDVLYRGLKLALAAFLPLNKENWITYGNALRLDWLSICQPTGTGVKHHAEDLFHTPLDQLQINFENEGWETYICGNPPYKGSQTQTTGQNSDLAHVFDPYGISSKQLDYVGGWFMKAAGYAQHTAAESGFVSTNSICQGRIVPTLRPKVFETGSVIHFALTSFKCWASLASYNAGVTVAIVALSSRGRGKQYLFEINNGGETTVREATNITPYLTTGENVIVASQRESIAGLHGVSFGIMPVDGGCLLMSADEAANLGLTASDRDVFVRRIYGSAEFIRGLVRYCLWVPNERLERALEIEPIRARVEGVRAMRLASKDAGTREMAANAHQLREMYEGKRHTLIPCTGQNSWAQFRSPSDMMRQGSSMSRFQAWQQ